MFRTAIFRQPFLLRPATKSSATTYKLFASFSSSHKYPYPALIPSESTRKSSQTAIAPKASFEGFRDGIDRRAKV
ncbi:hypothetical protein Prudu_016934 [Prunus dulcis]|uniref:Uncharacterized protein n=1 Tax=Prunus dulcis TaxID=3755 RepID=A0A4Y1RMK9_PRUDU|nr:hypothetical protein Prudu_016934 [Prunus dulcis]